MPVPQRGHEREEQSVELLGSHPRGWNVLEQVLESPLKGDLAAAIDVWIRMGLFQDRDQLSRVMYQFLPGENPAVLGKGRTPHDNKPGQQRKCRAFQQETHYFNSRKFVPFIRRANGGMRGQYNHKFCLLHFVPAVQIKDASESSFGCIRLLESNSG